MASIRTCEEKDARLTQSIANNEHRRHSSADASCRAVTMYFAFARVHHAQIAFAVHNLAAQFHLAEAHHGLGWRSKNTRCAMKRFRANLKHTVPGSFDGRSLKFHGLSL